MQIRFAKWQGTGNDFILIDDRDQRFPDQDLGLVQRLCDRHFGVGSDGLILIQPPAAAGMDFDMVFFNPDGSQSFCGNGSRCAFAFWSGLTGERHAAFTAIDGEHRAEWMDGQVAVTMRDTGAMRNDGEPHVDFVHTGSPHELVHVADPSAVDLPLEGPRRRYDPRHAPGGTNVNFMHVDAGVVHMRTYERGVEHETLSCGTGVVAAALSALHRGLAQAPVQVHTPGGRLRVDAHAAPHGFTSIRLMGPVGEVFQGAVTIH